MSLSKSTYHSKLYLDFKSIHPEAHRDIVRFFDENEKAVRQLDAEEFFDLYVSYVNALFMIGKYRKYLLLVDHIIEQAIGNNIYVYHGQDIFFEMLTCKALSFLYTYEFEKAETIFRQLIRIDPQREELDRWLEQSIRRRGALIQYRSRALGVGLLIFCAMIIGVEILLIRPFYAMYVDLFEWSRNLLFLSACMIMLAGEGMHRYRSRHEARRFHKEVSNQHKSENQAPE